jgi:glucose-1-phosphate thymidylyltransferase
LKMACPEEIAYHFGLIDRERLKEQADRLAKSAYGRYLHGVLEEKPLGLGAAVAEQR